MTDYQIEDTFTTDPALKGWIQFNGTAMHWDNIVQAIGGNLQIDDQARMIKYLGKALTQLDNITALFTFSVAEILASSGECIVGFFDVNELDGKEHCFGMIIRTDTGVAIPHIYIAYSDGTKVEGSGAYTLNNDDKYVIAIRYVPEDGKAYLEVFDFLTQTLLFQEEVSINSSKALLLNQVGISESDAGSWVKGGAWVYDMKAVGEPTPVVYSSLYCTPEEARKMTNLDAVKDMTDEMIAQIERVYAIPQVNARFRSEGYDAPFDTGVDTPPLIRAITALLTAAYACKKAYTGHAPNESPNYTALTDEVNKIWTDILKGRMELIDIDGDWIQRTMPTSTDMLSTSEGQTNIFSLADIGMGIGSGACANSS